MKALLAVFVFCALSIFIHTGDLQAGGEDEAIAKGNLFHPNRTIPAPPARASRPKPPAPQATPTPPAPPKFALSGVVLADGEAEIAVLAEPALTQGRPQVVVKGEQIGTYRLAEVSADRVVLEAEEQRVVVLLFDPTKPRPGMLVAAPKPIPGRGAAAPAARLPSPEGSPRPAPGEETAPAVTGERPPDPPMPPPPQVLNFFQRLKERAGAEQAGTPEPPGLR